ncbi:unnamed protein product [Blepharisma stoltei]|uniref:Uncharacterized protein n=1 Tax=Blepharisma stoltei TaxID=1481888 RepID=A0AAU9K1K0_9CILI|nr:unnamed protein product [Blepharisma stoltei]
MEEDGTHTDKKIIENFSPGIRVPKLMHPQLQKVLEEIKTPSPCFLPRDNFQPISGKIVYAIRNPINIVTQDKPVTKPPINLNLVSSVLLRRRNIAENVNR